MAHLFKIFKAGRLKKKLKCYQRLKESGRRRHLRDYESSKGSAETVTSLNWLTTCGEKIRTWSAVESIAWNSLIGFLGGVILTYAFFILFHLGVNISLHSTTYISAVAGITLSLGLAFSTNVRCYVLLLLPVFFSKEGRQALLAYALFLAFTGPARNTMHNMGILSDSMNCGQEIVKKTFKQIIEMVKMPSKSIKEMLWKIKEATDRVVTTIKNTVIKIKRAIIIVLEVIKAGSVWLRSIITICNKKVGTPFQRCMKSFDVAIAECKSKMGVLNFLCHVVHITEALCYTVKSLDFICLFTEFVSDKVVETVKKKLRKFHIHMKELFYVSIELNHSYEYETKTSNTTKHLAKTILQRFSEKVEKFQSIFSVFGFMYSLLFVFLFANSSLSGHFFSNFWVKKLDQEYLLVLEDKTENNGRKDRKGGKMVYYYKYKYLSSDQYDNVYINKYIVDLDIQRAQRCKETVLPLEPRERKKYGKLTSVRLLECERSRIAQSMFLLSLTSFKVITFVAVDYCLFWILLTIYKAGHDALKEVEDSKFGIKVVGEGVIADFYRKLGKIFEVPKNPYMRLTPLHCLPDPLQPDTRRYVQIGFLVLLCWILTLTEAYGLRLRSVIMSYYYPDRARERAIWLYNHILRSRGSFIRFARRQLRKKFGTNGVMPVEKMTCTQKLFINFPLLGLLWRKHQQKKCLLCGISEAKTRPETLKRCKTPDCPGRYCTECFVSLKCICTICQHPIDYGDISDISEEVDSSEEDLRFRKQNENFKCVSDSSEDDIKRTFRDMETRESFRDLEANEIPDYVKEDDVNFSATSLRGRLSTLLEQINSRTRLSIYRQIKSILIKKINTLKKLREGKANVSDEMIIRETSSFLPERSSGEQTLSYSDLREEVKAKLISFKKNRLTPKQSMKRACSLQIDVVNPAEDDCISDDSDDDISQRRFFSYYFVERERKSPFCPPEAPAKVRFSGRASGDKTYVL